MKRPRAGWHGGIGQQGGSGERLCDEIPGEQYHRPKNSAGEDKLYFVCRTYQRFTKAGVCTSHTIKEQTVTQAVIEKVQEICWQYLQADKLLPMAKREVAKALAEASNEKEIVSLKAKIDSLTAHLDKVYMDKLSGILDEADFQRICTKVKADRAALEQRLSQLDHTDCSPAEQVEAT